MVEGCCIPFNWKADFECADQEQIRYTCLIFSQNYILTHYKDIRNYANTIEQRIEDETCTQEMLLHENRENLEKCIQYGCDYILIGGAYCVDITF